MTGAREAAVSIKPGVKRSETLCQLILGNGFAAGCEAAAMPRRTDSIQSLGATPRGAAPKMKMTLTEGHSRFRRSQLRRQSR